MRLLGVWPDRKENERRKLMMDIRAIVILFVMTSSCLIPCLHSLVRIWDNLTAMIDNLQYTTPFLITMLKFFTMWRKKKVLVPVLEMIKEDWSKLKTEEERSVMIRRAHTARIITMWGYFIMILLIIFSVVLPFFGISLRYVTNTTDPDKIMPLQTYYIYDVSKSPYYELTFTLQAVSIISAGAMFTTMDNFLGLLVLHVCGQLENLRERILHLDDNDFESALSYSVRDHRRLIRFIKIIDDTFTMTLLALLSYFGLLFALHGFLFVTMLAQGHGFSFGRLIFILFIFIGAFTHMCLYCIVGEILVVQCDGIYDAVCEYEWYKLEPRKARNLMMIMIRANQPLYLTAGKLFPMTMSTFCNLLKTSGGYISVLLAQRE